MNTKSVINVASVPHRSPFRYPGEKTWLVPHVRKWLNSLSRKPTEFVEPFAGGAIVGLSVVFEHLAESTTLVELDEAVAAVWRVVLNGKAAALAERIVEFEVSMQSVRDILDAKPRGTMSTGFTGDPEQLRLEKEIASIALELTGQFTSVAIHHVN